MKQQFSILIFLLFSAILPAQYHKADVDVAALVSECKKMSDNEKVICSEQIIKDHFLFEIDQEVCPLEDSTKTYHISFMVDERGNINSSQVISHKNESLCLQYFIQKADEFSRTYKMTPARAEGSRVQFKKRIHINYPPYTNIEPYNPDSIAKKSQLEVSPIFTGCEQMIGSDDDKRGCGSMKMLTFIYRNLKYPAKARNKSIEGTVVCQFVINQDGFVENPVIKRGIGGNCDEEVLRIVKSMNQLNPPFRPAYFGEQPVKSLYTIPVKFKLE